MKQVHIQYLGHACFCLEAEGYRTVLDPYIDGMIPGLPPLRVEAEAVYCSHQHEDHNFLPAVSLQKTVHSAPYTIREFVTPHDGEGGRLRGMNTVRIFDFGGLRVAHMGDVGRPLTREEAAILRSVDCLLIPVGGFYTIDAHEAKAMAEQIQPRVLIPMHYRTKTTGFAEIAPLEDFTGLYPHVEYGGSSVELTKETPEQVLVLNRAYEN